MLKIMDLLNMVDLFKMRRFEAFACFKEGNHGLQVLPTFHLNQITGDDFTILSTRL